MEICDIGNRLIKRSEKFAEVMSVCSTLLKHSSKAEKARIYLKSRVPTYNVAGFVIGYFPENKDINLITDVIGEKHLQELGLVYNKYVHDYGIAELKPHSIISNHNIIMPYKNVYGDIIGIVGRTLLSKEEQKLKKISKYKNSSLPKGLNLFGIYNAKDYILAKDSVIIVEGQFDCITCHRYGFKNVVALGGATFSKYHFYLLKRYTNNIYLLLDNDEAGQREKIKIIDKFGKFANIKPIMLDSRYKDIDKYLTNSTDHSLLSI
jgi:DNA primase